MARFQWTGVKHAPTASGVTWTKMERDGSDPYLIWLDLTTAQNLAAQESPSSRMGVLVELRDVGAAGEFFKLMNSEADPYKADFVLSAIMSDQVRFITGLVTMRGLRKLIDPSHRGLILRFTLQESRCDSTLGLLKQARNWREGHMRAAKAAEASRPTTDANYKAPAGETVATGSATTAYLGIIDDGLPLMRLRDAISLSKVAASLWDQGWQPSDRVGDPLAEPTTAKPGDKYWTVPWSPDALPIVGPWGATLFLFIPNGFLYGRRTKFPEVPAAAEADEYRASGYVTPSARHTHGARVLGLMAPWIAGETRLPEWPPYITGLVMVQLPSRAVDDTAAGTLARQLVDGVRHVLWKEALDRDWKGTPRPVVVNISYGMHGGPHDGTSMFERALDEMLDVHTNLHVVLPMGNSHRAGCHARHRLEPRGRDGSTREMHIEVQPDNPRDMFVEVWLDPDACIELTLFPPGSATGYPIERGEARVATKPTPAGAQRPETISFAVFYPHSVAQSTRRTMILLVIAPTRCVPYGHETSLPPRGLGEQPRLPLQGVAGIWRVEARNLGKTEACLDCWIERDDVRPGQWLAPRQARFPDSCVVPTGESDPVDTINGIATSTHERAYVIGAMRADAVLSDYSSAGNPAYSDRQPWRVAPADWSCAVSGVRTTGFLQGSTVRINGTSAAAAVFTRRLVDVLCGSPASLPPVPVQELQEIRCAPERWPAAPPETRGESRRALLPFGIDLASEFLSRSGQSQVPR